MPGREGRAWRSAVGEETTTSRADPGAARCGMVGGAWLDVAWPRAAGAAWLEACGAWGGNRGERLSHRGRPREAGSVAMG